MKKLKKGKKKIIFKVRPPIQFIRFFQHICPYCGEVNIAFEYDYDADAYLGSEKVVDFLLENFRVLKITGTLTLSVIPVVLKTCKHLKGIENGTFIFENPELAEKEK